MHTDIYQTVGIQHDIMTFGTTIKGHLAADLPMKFEVTMDTVMEKISMKINVPKEVCIQYWSKPNTI